MLLGRLALWEGWILFLIQRKDFQTYKNNDEINNIDGSLVKLIKKEKSKPVNFKNDKEILDQVVDLFDGEILR